jgi:hypothetical protein
MNDAAVLVDLHMDQTTGTSTITLSMDANTAGKWVGVGFNASSMADCPYAIIADAAGNGTIPKVQERKLGEHNAGTKLSDSVKVRSDSTVSGKRIVVLERPLSGPTSSHYSFTATRATLPVLVAIGSAGAFTTAAVHTFKTGAIVPLAPVSAPVCLCRDPSSNTGTIGGRPFNSDICAPYPTSSLLTGSEFGLNGICNISTYGGGLYCCGGGSVLLDKDQEIPEPTDTWYMKYRFYFEDYEKQLNLYRVWWGTEAYNNEYDVPKSKYDCTDPVTPAENCTHIIKSKFTGTDILMGGEIDLAAKQAGKLTTSSCGDVGCACMVRGNPDACMNVSRVANEYGGKYRLMYAALHCHAPACMSMELWNDDTGELICRNDAVYGNGTTPHNEKAYLVGIPPCLWGSTEEGLAPPPIMHLDANYSALKRANNTNGHWGVMALWQMRAAYMEA